MRHDPGPGRNISLYVALLLLTLLPCGCDSIYREREIHRFGFEDLCEALRREGASIYGEDGAAPKEEAPPPNTLQPDEPPPPREIDVVDDDTLYSFELRGATLANAVSMIGETAGLNILLEGDFSETVEASLPQVTINEALGRLLSIHRCTIERRGGVFVISRVDPSTLQTRIYRLRSVAVADVSEGVRGLLGESGTLVTDRGSNVISLTAPAGSLAAVDAYLESIDRVEKQVLIEARIVEFSLTDLYELGTSLNFGDIGLDAVTATFLTDFLTASQSAVATVAGDNTTVDGALRALSQLTRVNIMSHPNVVASNGEEALIEILEEVPYVDSTITTTGDAGQGVGTSSVENVEFKEVGIKLKVTPSILNDECISLALDQDVSEQVDTFNNIPVVNHRHIQTNFSVENNHTIIIGGLMKEYYFDEESGVPFFKDLPLLGFLFRGTTRVKEKVELVVLITPRLVSPASSIAVPSRIVAEKVERTH